MAALQTSDSEYSSKARALDFSFSPMTGALVIVLGGFLMTVFGFLMLAFLGELEAGWLDRKKKQNVRRRTVGDEGSGRELRPESNDH